MDTVNSIINELHRSVINTKNQNPNHEDEYIDHENVEWDRYCVKNCSICGGSGWVRVNAPLHTDQFGKLSPCPNSNPFKRYRHISGLNDEDCKQTWSNIIKRTPETEDAVKKIAEVIGRGYGWVTIWGDYGLAKTLLLQVACVEFMRRQRQPASYARMEDIILNLREAFDTNNPNTESTRRLELWGSLKLLAIDEFEKVNETDYAVNKRFSLMDRRYEQAIRRRGITLVASNKNPSTFEGYLYDRMQDGRFDIIKLTGKSARPMMKY